MKKILALGAILFACALFATPAAAALPHAALFLHQVGHLDLSSVHFGIVASMLAAAPAFEQKDAGDPADPTAAIEKIGTAFEEFRKSHDEQIKELKEGKDDPVLAERLSKIEKSLDTAQEAKSALEVSIAAEKKEREELELRLQRLGVKGDGDGAKREVERKEFNILLAAQAAEQKTAAVEFDEKGYEGYKTAFNRFLRKNDRLLTPDEVKTLQVGSDPDGGYLVTPDVTGRIARKIYETSPIRRLASVQPISTDALEGMEDLGEAGAGYAGEHSQSGDQTTPQLGKWRIPVFLIDTEPKATQQLLDDAVVDVEAWLGGKVANKFSRFENSEFVNGAANKIRGFAAGYTMALDDGTGVTWGQIGYVATGVNSSITSADKLHDLIGAVKVDYLNNANFVTRRSVVTLLRKLKDTTNQYIWQPSLVLGAPETLMGYPLVRAEDMPALANTSKSLAFGDFREAYQIVDRQGVRVLRDPYTSKPYVKFYTTRRTGGGVINFEAIKLLSFG
jgi:HK97 family phage major capsid protein